LQLFAHDDSTTNMIPSISIITIITYLLLKTCVCYSNLHSQYGNCCYTLDINIQGVPMGHEVTIFYFT